MILMDQGMAAMEGRLWHGNNGSCVTVMEEEL